MANGGRIRSVRQNPSRSRLREFEKTIHSEKVPIDADKTIHWIEATLNGKSRKMMMTDLGIKEIRLSARLASEVGARPAPGDPAVDIATIDGRTIRHDRRGSKQCRSVRSRITTSIALCSPRVPAMSPRCLAASFFNQFSTRIDADAGAIVLTQVQVKPILHSSKAAAAKSAGSSKTKKTAPATGRSPANGSRTPCLQRGRSTRTLSGCGSLARSRSMHRRRAASRGARSRRCRRSRREDRRRGRRGRAGRRARMRSRLRSKSAQLAPRVDVPEDQIAELAAGQRPAAVGQEGRAADQVAVTDHPADLGPEVEVPEDQDAVGMPRQRSMAQGEPATQRTGPGALSRRTLWRDLRSQSHIVPSSQPASTPSPPVVARATTALSCNSGEPEACPVATSQMRMVLSAPPESASWSPRANTTANTAAVCPSSRRMPTSCSDRKSQSLTVLSADPESPRRPSAVSATAVHRAVVIDAAHFVSGRDIPEADRLDPARRREPAGRPPTRRLRSRALMAPEARARRPPPRRVATVFRGNGLRGAPRGDFGFTRGFVRLRLVKDLAVCLPWAWAGTASQASSGPARRATCDGACPLRTDSRRLR